MKTFEYRYSRRKGYVINGSTAVGYVRCGIPEDWQQNIRKGRVSTRSGNPLYGVQQKRIQKGARTLKLELWQTYCELEKHGPGRLSSRHEFAKLLIEIEQAGIRNMVVEFAGRLSDDPYLLVELLDYLHSLNLRVFDAFSLADLTQAPEIAEIKEYGSEEELARARGELGLFKALVTRKRRRVDVGRKPFGTIDSERPSGNLPCPDRVVYCIMYAPLTITKECTGGNFKEGLSDRPHR